MSCKSQQYSFVNNGGVSRQFAVIGRRFHSRTHSSTLCLIIVQIRSFPFGACRISPGVQPAQSLDSGCILCSSRPFREVDPEVVFEGVIYMLLIELKSSLDMSLVFSLAPRMLPSSCRFSQSVALIFLTASEASLGGSPWAKTRRAMPRSGA